MPDEQEEMTTEKLEELNDKGEIAVEFEEEPESKKEQVEESRADSIEVDGVQYTPSQIKELKEQAERSRLMQADYTRKTQEVAKEKSALQQRLEDMAKNVSNDDVLKSTYELMIEQQKELDEIRRTKDEQVAQIRAESQKQQLMRLKEEAEKEFGEKLPDPSSKEFGDILKVLEGINPFKAYLLMKGSTRKETPQAVVDKAGSSDDENPNAELVNKAVALAKKFPGVKNPSDVRKFINK